MYAFVFALLALGFMHEIKPYIQPPDPLKPRIMDFAAEISVVGTEDVPALIKKSSGKPLMLVVFASWCGYCRMQMPDIIALKREGKLNHIDTLFLSRDYELYKLSEYMVHSGYYKDFKPQLVKDGMFSDTLTEVMRGAGSGYNGQIPYIEIYDAQGNRVEILPKGAGRKEIATAVKKL